MDTLVPKLHMETKDNLTVIVCLHDFSRNIHRLGVTDTWFRFLVKKMRFDRPRIGLNKDYEWLKLNIFTRWNASTRGHVVIVFDSRPDTQRLLTNIFVDIIDRIRSEDPYSVHVPLAEVAVHLYNETVWKIRTKIREIEESRSALADPPKQHFLYLHDLARHAIHTIETLDLAARALRSMIEYSDQFAAAYSTRLVATDDRSNDSAQAIETLHQGHNQTPDRFRFYENVIQGLRLRSIANDARLQNESQISFHIVAQSIAITSNEISGAIHINSSVMKTVGLTTAAFVPMMYIATVFGMPFFIYSVDHGHLDVSDKFWVYWAVAVPFTCMACLLSYSFHSMINSGEIKATGRESRSI